MAATATSTCAESAASMAPAVIHHMGEQDGQQPMTTLARWVPSLPAISFQQLNPFATNGSCDASNANKQMSEVAQHNTAKSTTTSRRPVLSTLFPTSTKEGPPLPSRSSTSVMFAEPDVDSNSGSNDSREGSIDDRKRRQRRKTSFSVCHPPPTSTTRQKLHRRPRSLLQLHRLSASERPVPAFEVVPSANFNVKLTRAITKVFRARHGLCASDLVVMKAEKYALVEEEVEEEEAHVIGLICKGRKDKDDLASATGKAKVYMRNGQEWEAYPLMNGGYEFFATDEHGLGLTVRWVPKKGSKGKETKRFNFSTISPNSRRHPVIAALSKTNLEIYDTYKLPDPSMVTPLSTPRNAQFALEQAMEAEGGQEQCETDDFLREIITMTSIYVTFKEGWSPTFRYDDKGKDAPLHSRSASAASNLPSPLKSPPGSPQVAVQKRNSVKSVGSSILRRSASLMPGNRASQASIPDDAIAEGCASPRCSTSARGGRARGDSTSTVLVQRAASNRRKQAATWRPDFLDANHQLNETSREHLNGTPPPARRTEAWGTTPDRRTSMVAEPLIPADVSPSGAPTPREAQTAPPLVVHRTESHRDSNASVAEEKLKSERSVSNGTQSTFDRRSPPKVPEIISAADLVELPGGNLKVQGAKRKKFWRAISICVGKGG